ncbi:hypothetical protein KKA95_04150 [Patescibacteria group bacterium]|nr:hypothetical protein [Patescibacteria group bacterium]
MKKTLINLIVLALLSSIGFTQKSILADKSLNQTAVKEAFILKTDQDESFPISGSHLLREKEQKILDYLETHPEYRQLNKTRSTAWNFAPGDPYDWWADSLIDNAGQYQVSSTCRAIGTDCYIFVEDVAWQDGWVNQEAVDAIVDAFDNNIYPTDTETFGNPPNVDTDDKIIILILDIKDDYSIANSGAYTAGYFYSANEYPDGDAALGGIRSNYAEIFYMDCFPANLSTSGGRNQVFGTTAHEFQHMIHWAYDDNEMTFVNEGLSMIAEYVCGYGLRNEWVQR